MTPPRPNHLTNVPGVRAGRVWWTPIALGIATVIVVLAVFAAGITVGIELGQMRTLERTVRIP